ncbi:FkbM family methyltransferase [Brachyspira hyodysenteriae]|uniref:Methyltransferase n=2 Tax=Brachyspira hyodysenteriae TaxID=159 RepID=A0A3B6VBL2_BRAHW|nr:FkbM family methyltransferase [Brachyspira hyodysenteriae]ACN84720.1 methyltransferase [Brachyspira hyodysenteriae WA1]AUJ50451.1 methyltransferase [Brachyspira hyodysenteriae]KLI16710.1 methyltransferase [Brachyspira hyodysenteriae]KLI22014.1 methyltransferase [Brachyspira hyodysenteriae]KLI39866.1 methyltransferase [Brachyspira hyodysenteriae]
MEKINKIFNECRTIVSKNLSKEEIEKIENNDNFIKAMKEENNNSFDVFYNMLEESYSKDLFEKIVRYRYMLAFNKNAYTNSKEKIKLSIKYGSINIFSWGLKRFLFALQKYKYPKEIENFLLFYIFGLEQYNIKNIFEVNNDSVIFDVGAWKGDTAYFFSKKCNDNAKIYAFEPDKNAYETLKFMKEKYKLNNVILKNVLFSNKKETIDFVSMTPDTPTVKMDAITIDEFVENDNIERIDYLKMDVEGAEMHIFEGAVNTIKKFRPSIAVAVYHGGELFMEDFYKVPIFIKKITENYEYYLRTFSPWGGETILFCIPKK